MNGKRNRLSKLETAQRKWEAEHIPLPHVFAYLLDVLNIISEEAGPEIASRAAGRVVGAQLRQVEVLQRWRQ